MDVILLNVQFVACNHNTKALGRLKSGSPNPLRPSYGTPNHWSKHGETVACCNIDFCCCYRTDVL